MDDKIKLKTNIHRTYIYICVCMCVYAIRSLTSVADSAVAGHNYARRLLFYIYTMNDFGSHGGVVTVSRPVDLRFTSLLYNTSE